jgi:hypothetical protein
MLIRYENFIFNPHRIEYIEERVVEDKDYIPEITSKFVNVEAEGGGDIKGIVVVFYQGYEKFLNTSIDEFEQFLTDILVNNPQ